MIGLPIYHFLDKNSDLYNFLMELDRRGGTVCGGFARLCAIQVAHVGDIADDIDIYPQTEKSFESIVGYLTSLNNFSGHMRETTSYPGTTELYEGHLEYNKSTSGQFKLLRYKNRIKSKVQVIKQFGTPEQILKTFDFTICQAYMDLSKFLIYTTPEFLRDQEKREITMVDGYDYGEDRDSHMQYRIDKYREKGYRVTVNTFLNFLKNIEREDWPYYTEWVTSGPWKEDLEKDGFTSGETLKFIGALQSL